MDEGLRATSVRSPTRKASDERRASVDIDEGDALLSCAFTSTLIQMSAANDAAGGPPGRQHGRRVFVTASCQGLLHLRIHRLRLRRQLVVF